MSRSFEQTVPANATIVGTFGNSYLLETPDGSQHTVARTPAYEIAYVYGESTLVFGDEATSLRTFESDNAPAMQVGPTDDRRSYRLAPATDDGMAIRTPPAKYAAVLNGILEALQIGETTALAHLYDTLRETHISVDLVEAVQHRYAPVPPASVQSATNGWIIEDLFLLTWYGSIHLVTEDLGRQTYRVARTRGTGGTGVTASADISEFIGLEPDGQSASSPAPITLPVDGEERTLNDSEMAFLTKARWLVDYRQRHDDELFWDLIERFVQQGRKRSTHRAAAGESRSETANTGHKTTSPDTDADQTQEEN